MSFLRPEAKEALWRWREPMAGAAVALLGAWWTFGTGLMPWVGWPLVAAGAALIVAGLQRVRFRRGGQGPGVVTVDERRVAYMGPLDGGTVDLADLDTLTLDPASSPPVWRLATPERTLAVPVSALGSEALFDAFASLPGLDTGRMLAELEGGRAEVVVWSRPRSRRLLH